MNGQVAVQSGLSVEKYLALERASEIKHEFFRGEIFAMAGASREHNLITGNIVRELGSALRERPCEVYPSDMRVKVEATGLYTYPDVIVVCGKPVLDDEQRDTLLNPTVIFEVLSDSTEAYDRGKKFENYRTIPSLSEYVLVSQKEPLIEHFVRLGGGKPLDDGGWVMREVRAGGAVTLATIGSSLAVDEAYLKVFAAE